jgi:hypothetical protein
VSVLLHIERLRGFLIHSNNKKVDTQKNLDTREKKVCKKGLECFFLLINDAQESSAGEQYRNKNVLEPAANLTTFEFSTTTPAW